MKARSTTLGVPFSSSTDTSASPTPSSVITCATSSFGIGAERLRRRLHRLLILGREGAQRVLHAVAELAEHGLGHVERALACRSRRRRPSSGSGARRARSRPPTPSACRRRADAPRRRRTRASACPDRRLPAAARRARRAARGGTSSRAPALCISLSAARMLTTPWPPSTVCMRSSRSSAGSPKNCSPPCCSSASRPRWMAPMLAVETLPYVVLISAAWSPTSSQHGAQVLQVEQQQAAVVGDLEDDASARPPASR